MLLRRGRVLQGSVWVVELGWAIMRDMALCAVCSRALDLLAMLPNVPQWTTSWRWVILVATGTHSTLRRAVDVGRPHRAPEKQESLFSHTHHVNTLKNLLWGGAAAGGCPRVGPTGALPVSGARRQFPGALKHLDGDWGAAHCPFGPPGPHLGACATTTRAH